MKNLLRKNLYIIGGTVILAIGVEYFVYPLHILAGGSAGIAVALYPLFHIDQTLMANLIVLGFLILGYFILGRDFFFSSVLSSIVFTVLTTVLSPYVQAPQISEAMSAFYAGLLSGAGVGLVMKAGGSTGGTDVPELILHKITGLKVSTVALLVEGSIVLLGIFSYGLEAALTGLICVMVSSYTMDRILTMNGAPSKSVQIVSDSYREISQAIQQETGRGVTLIPAAGGYQGTPRQVLLVVVANNQYGTLIDLVNRIDPHAFVITTDATDMHGEGFTYPSAE